MSRYILSKISSSSSENPEKVKMTLRWENWVRVKIYKWISMQILSDNIGVDRSNTMSPQKLINIACAYKLGMDLEEETHYIDDDELKEFVEHIDKDVHTKVKAEVERLKHFDPAVSINTWTKEAVLEYINITSRAK